MHFLTCIDTYTNGPKLQEDKASYEIKLTTQEVLDKEDIFSQ